MDATLTLSLLRLQSMSSCICYIIVYPLDAHGALTTCHPLHISAFSIERVNEHSKRDLFKDSFPLRSHR